MDINKPFLLIAAFSLSAFPQQRPLTANPFCARFLGMSSAEAIAYAKASTR